MNRREAKAARILADDKTADLDDRIKAYLAIADHQLKRARTTFRVVLPLSAAYFIAIIVKAIVS